ncbi:MAG: ribosome-associated ATPase/putative transporter RbbA [Pseudomonadota bacterium]
MAARAADNVAAIADIRHSYGSVNALDGLTADVPAGQMVGLLGPDGVGKSTLLGVIAGARILQSGQAMVLGGDIADRRHRERIGPRIAFMPQGLGKNLYAELSVAENLEFFGQLFGQSRAERRARIERLTEATGLHPFLDRPAGKLSGGMKQKLGLCCALIHDPDFLILDEPTTGVDPLSRRQFWELIKGIRAARPTMSVLVSTAYMDEANEFDWLIAMNAGQVLASGTPRDLLDRTDAEDLETAFVRLLPGMENGRHSKIAIPPFAPGDGPPAITARGLTKRFGDFTAVRDVSFDIQPGEIFGFLGSNGCGKTTTMKMLTGLLQPSEGDAAVFGHPVNAADMTMRRRVGFMSQSFSLYGELTVHENLTLHGRLFHLSAAQVKARTETLLAQFGLEAHAHSRASALPLGIRQRLSLAVAIVHEPEILILDEPTSGVDPVARDQFWELLIKLSREDGVTIFISTHFMTEATRCDRISFMHAGQVMVYDTPAALVAAKGVETLEDAFILYTEEAGAGDAAVFSTGIVAAEQDEPEAVSKRGSTVHQFSATRMMAYSFRELTEVWRDPVRLVFAFAGSVILLLIMSFGIDQDVDEVTFAVVDFDQTPESRAYVASFVGSHYFTEIRGLRTPEALDRRMQEGSLSVGLEIPAGFGRDLQRGTPVEVLAEIDGANPSRAATIESYVEGVHRTFLRDRNNLIAAAPSATAEVTQETRMAYNPTSESLMTMGPSIPAMLLIMFPAILMAVSIAREKEIGTITNFYVTPTRRAEFLLGKQLPYVLIAMINFAMLYVLVVIVLQVPLKGSLLALTVGGFFYALAATSYGLMISTLTKSQVTAVFAAAILSMLPTISFSGLIQPVSTLEGGARAMGSLWPTTYFMQISVGSFTKGLSLAELRGDLFALAAFFPVFFGLGLLALKKQEK